MRLCTKATERLWRLFLVAIVLPGAVVVADGPAFEEVALPLGLDFRHDSGLSGKLYAAEHMGPGVALFDYDNDGDLDVFFGQGGSLDDVPPEQLVFAPRYPPPPSGRLYRNDLTIESDGRRALHFTDVTETAGLRARGYNMGVASGDYDGDGWVDLYVTNLGPNQLLRNRGDGTFLDVTAQAGADDTRFSVPASFFDFDGDGRLDLFIGNYNDFRVPIHKACYTPQGALDYCGPLAYAAEPDRLLRNRGDGTFEDVTVRSGLAGVAATALGSVSADFNGDGLVDLYVANDQMANHMWINQGGGRFLDDALLLGTALDGYGKPEASMGVVAEDLNGDGHVDLFVSHLERETNTLYLNDARGMFVDASETSQLGAPSYASTGFGTAALDYDGDQVADLYVVNGAVRRIPAQLEASDPHPLHQSNQLFRGLGNGRFAEIPDNERETPVRSEVSRGLAVGDLDNDGDPDLVVTNNSGRARLLRNRRQPGSRWIGLRLLDREGRADVFGALATIGTPQRPVWKRAHTDGSYAAASDPRLLFALDAPGGVTARVRWPGGDEEEFTGLEPGRYLTLKRGTGRTLPTATERSP